MKNLIALRKEEISHQKLIKLDRRLANVVCDKRVFSFSPLFQKEAMGRACDPVVEGGLQ